MSEEDQRSIILDLSEKCQALEIKVCKLINSTNAKRVHLSNFLDEYQQLSEQFEKFLGDHESVKRDELVRARRENEELEKKLTNITRLNSQLSEQVQSRRLGAVDQRDGLVNSIDDMEDIYSISKNFGHVEECCNNLAHRCDEAQQELNKTRLEADKLISEMQSLNQVLSKNDAIIQVSQMQNRLAEQQLDTMAVHMPYESIEESVLSALQKSDNANIRDVAGSIAQYEIKIAELKLCLENQAKDKLAILDELVCHVNTFARRREEALTVEQQ